MSSIFDGAVTSGEDEPLTVPFSAIPAIPPTSLWPGVVPNRTPVMFAAPAGTSKGLLIAAVTARVTAGELFPGEPPGREPGQVIMVSPEDDPNEDMAFRLRAAGANLELVRDLTILPDGAPFMLPSGEQALRQAIAEANEDGPPVRLVTLDPLLAISESNLSSARAARSMIAMLQGVAADSGVAMIVSHHTTKNGEVAGSKELTNACRLVWLIKRVSGDPGVRAMSVYKTNRSVAPGPRYLVTGDGQDARVVLIGAGSTVAGSRAAKLRLGEGESPEQVAQRWLDAHPENKEGNGKSADAAGTGRTESTGAVAPGADAALAGAPGTGKESEEETA